MCAIRMKWVSWLVCVYMCAVFFWFCNQTTNIKQYLFVFILFYYYYRIYGIKKTTKNERLDEIFNLFQYEIIAFVPMIPLEQTKTQSFTHLLLDGERDLHCECVKVNRKQTKEQQQQQHQKHTDTFGNAPSATEFKNQINIQVRRETPSIGHWAFGILLFVGFNLRNIPKTVCIFDKFSEHKANARDREKRRRREAGTHRGHRTKSFQVLL